MGVEPMAGGRASPTHAMASHATPIMVQPPNSKTNTLLFNTNCAPQLICVCGGYGVGYPMQTQPKKKEKYMRIFKRVLLYIAGTGFDPSTSACPI